MKKPLETKINIVMLCVLIGLVILIVGQTVFANNGDKAADNAVKVSAYATDDMATPDNVAAVKQSPSTAQPTTQKPTQKPTQAPTTEPKTEPTAKPTEEPEVTTSPPTEPETIPWATVMTLPTKCSFEEQWANGYIVAIDYPDKTYQTFHIELTEEDRDVLEHLCMGEFGTGGFIGAALIAQCVKDAMCFDGYKTVEDVRVQCRYDGSLNNTPSQEVKNAVSYIFDHDKAAVQHRIMYMYNPVLVSSAFHESQNYILTYGDVRFFDRWGY